MERVLCGVDGSDASIHALEWALDLTSRTGSDLVAARVFDPPQAELDPERDAELRDEERRQLESAAADLAGDRPRPTAVLLDGDPADALLAAAHDHDADLLVVGGRGAGGFLHLHLGSVAHHLTHHTTLPLAIVPPAAATSVSRLVVGCDGSTESEPAIRLAADLAPALGVDVTAVLAWEPLVEWVPESAPDSWHRQAEDEVRRWTEPIAGAGATVEIDVDRDIHPVAAIGRALEGHPGAVAVVGGRGIGGFAGLRLGRVPLQLLHQLDDPVIVVPASGRA